MGIKKEKEKKSSKSKEDKVKKSSSKVSKKESSKDKKKSKSKDKDEKKAKKSKRKEKEVEVVTPIKEKMKVSELMEHLAEESGVEKKQVKAVIEALSNVIKGSMVKKGCGEFTFPKLFKMRIKDIPAKKARKGISPFTGEETVFKAKPASRKVKILPMKTLKEVASPPKD